ncbi:unnamed protein product [Closterium sp. NIES-65]|nr:unnamed protein product [Closterium sp. NIES-65]
MSAKKVGQAVQADWDNREFVESLRLNIHRIYTFVNDFAHIHPIKGECQGLAGNLVGDMERQLADMKSAGIPGGWRLICSVLVFRPLYHCIFFPLPLPSSPCHCPSPLCLLACSTWDPACARGECQGPASSSEQQTDFTGATADLPGISGALC